MLCRGKREVLQLNSFFFSKKGKNVFKYVTTIYHRPRIQSKVLLSKIMN